MSQCMLIVEPTDASILFNPFSANTSANDLENTLIEENII